MKKSPFNKIIIPGYLFALTCLIYFLFITYSNLRITSVESHDFNSSLELKTATAAVFDDIRDIESGARGFVITGLENYLEPYNDGNKRIAVDLKNLDKAKRFKILSDETQVLQNLIKEKKSYCDNQVLLRRNNGLDPVIAMIQTGRGKQMMDSIRISVNHIETACISRLNKFNLDKKAMAKNTVTQFFIFGGVVIGFLSLSCLLLYKQFRKKKNYEEQIQYLSGIADQGHDAVIYTDLNFIITDWNEGATEIFGYSEAETIGKPSAVILKSTFENENRLTLTNEIFIHGHWKGEVVYKKKNNEDVFASVFAAGVANYSAEIAGFIFLIQDRTELKSVIQNFYGLLESVSDVVVMINENGIMQAANSQAEDLFGYSTEEITGKTADLIIPGLSAKLKKHFRQLLKGEEVNYSELIKANGRTKNGTVFPVELNLFSLQTIKGPILFITLQSISNSVLTEFKSMLNPQKEK